MPNQIGLPRDHAHIAPAVSTTANRSQLIVEVSASTGAAATYRASSGCPRAPPGRDATPRAVATVSPTSSSAQMNSSATFTTKKTPAVSRFCSTVTSCFGSPVITQVICAATSMNPPVSTGYSSTG
jgi:hypothetical protein